MPCLRLFGRRWGIADDDVIFAATPWFFHFVWIILLPILIQYVKPPAGCERTQYRSAVITLFALYVVALAEESALIVFALRGSIFDSHERRAVRPLLYLRLASLTIETGFLIYVSVVVLRTGERCTKGTNDEVWHVPAVVKAWIWTTWATVILTVLTMGVTFKFWPETSKEKSWEHRVRLVALCCCCSRRVSHKEEEGGATPLARMALVFASMFGYVDMTTSDFLAAFLLAAQLQRCRRKTALQHLAEDAEAIAAEDGAMSLASSDGLSMLSAETLQTSTRRRMTSAGIADAEAGDLQLRTYVDSRRPIRHSPSDLQHSSRLFPGKEPGSPAPASSKKVGGMPAMNGTWPGLGSAAHTFAPTQQPQPPQPQPQPQRPPSGRRQRSASEPVSASRFAAEAATGQAAGSGTFGAGGLETPNSAHRAHSRASGDTKDTAAAGAAAEQTQTAGRAAVTSATSADAAAGRTWSGAEATAAGVPAASPFAAAKQQQKGTHPSVAETHAGSSGQRSSKAWRQLMQATLREQLHQRQQTLQRKRGRFTADPQLAAEGRQMLAQAEAEARHGAGYHRPLAEAGEDRTASNATSSAPSRASDLELQAPSHPVLASDADSADLAPVADRLGSAANPPALPDEPSGNERAQQSADGSVDTAQSGSRSNLAAAGSAAAAAGSGRGDGDAAASGGTWDESVRPEQRFASAQLAGSQPAPGTASASANQQSGAGNKEPSWSPPWRKKRRPFRTASLASQPSASDSGLPHMHSGGLLTPSGMAGDLRPDRSAAENLVTFSGEREKVSDEDVAEAAHFVKYSFAAYGYLLYLFSKPIYSGLLQLCCGRWFGLMRTLLFSRSTYRLRNMVPTAKAPLPGPGVGNALNLEAIQQITGLAEEDILFVRFEGEGGQHCLPYFIALDREKQAVVLSIRGTLSLQDAMTDLLCDSARLDDWMREVPSGATPASFTAAQPPKRHASSGSKYAAHAGILDAAKAIVMDLQHTGVLRALFHQEEPVSQPAPAAEASASVGTARTAASAADSSAAQSATASASQPSADASLSSSAVSAVITAHSSADGSAAGSASAQSKASAAETAATADDREAGAGQTNGIKRISPTKSGLPPVADKVVAALRAQAAHVAPAIQKMLPTFPSDKDLAARLAGTDTTGWQLVITGHSLGAGAASLVALYAHNFFPRVKCWAFEPPGGLMTRVVSRALQPLCTSTALGKDWIPRLSVSSFERMRDDMMMAAVRCKVSKWVFILGTLLGKQWDENELFYTAEEVHEGPAAVLAEYRNAVAAARPGDPRDLALARQFVMPGRIMFMRPVKAGSKSRQKAATTKYEPVWVTCDDLAAEGILVSSRMMAEHMPDRLLRVLQRLATQRTGDPQGPPAAGRADSHAADVPLPSPDSLRSAEVTPAQQQGGRRSGQAAAVADGDGGGGRRSDGRRKSTENGVPPGRRSVTRSRRLDDLDFGSDDGDSE